MRYACTAWERGGIGIRCGLKIRWSLTLWVRVPPLLPRDVAQLGSASGLGPEGRRFESCHPDF